MVDAQQDVKKIDPFIGILVWLSSLSTAFLGLVRFPFFIASVDQHYF